eukprot:SAG11_NODE_4808_length_1759_cov_12.496988_1_plen_140_part_00
MQATIGRRSPRGHERQRRRPTGPLFGARYPSLLRLHGWCSMLAPPPHYTSAELHLALEHPACQRTRARPTWLRSLTAEPTRLGPLAAAENLCTALRIQHGDNAALRSSCMRAAVAAHSSSVSDSVITDMRLHDTDTDNS